MKTVLFCFLLSIFAKTSEAGCPLERLLWTIMQIPLQPVVPGFELCTFLYQVKDLMIKEPQPPLIMLADDRTAHNIYRMPFWHALSKLTMVNRCPTTGDYISSWGVWHLLKKSFFKCTQPFCRCFFFSIDIVVARPTNFPVSSS